MENFIVIEDISDDQILSTVNLNQTSEVLLWYEENKFEVFLSSFSLKIIEAVQIKSSESNQA